MLMAPAACMSTAAQCRLLAALLLTLAIIIIIISTCCCCCRAVTSPTDVILLLTAGIVTLLLLLMSLLALLISRLQPAESHTAFSLLTQFLLQTMLSTRGRLALRRLRQVSSHLTAAQTSLLTSVLRHNARTSFGRRHRFSDAVARAATRDDVRRAYIACVPLTTHDDYVDDVQRLLQSKDAASAGILTADRVEFLSYSSGTTGRNKLVPVTRWSKVTAATVVGPLMCQVLDQAVGGGRHLQRVVDLSYRAPVSRSPSGLRVGPISSYIGRRTPYVVSPPGVYAITDEPQAIHLHALFALSEPQVDRLEALFSTLVYAFWTHVERHWQRICEEIERGTVINDANIPVADADAACTTTSVVKDVAKDANSMESAQSSGCDSVAMLVASVAKQLRPDAQRAAELRRIFSGGFVGVALRVWPGLRAVRMLATGGFAPHARLLADTYMRGVPQLSLVHAASEGFYGVNVTAAFNDNDKNEERPKSLGPNSRYTVLPQLGFYEFIPVAAVEQRQPATLFADQVELGESYEMVYTSQTGLYRYRTGDVVKIVAFFCQSPVYEFQFRLSQTLNVYWEKTPESLLYSAVQAAVDDMDDVQLVDFTSTENVCLSHLPEYRCAGKCYVVFIELATREGEDDVILTERCESKFDSALRDRFELYAQCRAAGSIDTMRVHQVASGSFRRLRRLMTSSMMSSASSSSSSSAAAYNPQYKVPRVVRDRACLDLLVAASVRPSLHDE